MTRPDPTSRGQDGSVTVFVALLLPILAIMIFLVLNIGQLVFERIRLQNTACACALSAAAVQAAGLNEIAECNFWSQNWVLSMARLAMTMSLGMPWQSQATAQQAVDYYTGVFQALRDYQDKANEDYAREALSTARKVKTANLDDRGVTGITIKSVHPGSTFGSPGKLMEYETFTTPVPYAYLVSYGVPPKCAVWVALNWLDALAMDKKNFGPHFYAVPTATCGLTVVPGVAEFDYKIAKKSRPMTYSAFELRQPAKDFILAGAVFGRMKPMTAYAAAMPTNGSIKNGKPKYSAVLVRLRDLDPRPAVADLDKVMH